MYEVTPEMMKGARKLQDKVKESLNENDIYTTKEMEGITEIMEKCINKMEVKTNGEWSNHRKRYDYV